MGLLRLGDVLDVGSGDGVLAALLASRARSVTCLDRSETVINAASKRLAAWPNVTPRQGDMHAIPFPDGSFDQVLHFHALTYSTDPAKAVGEAYRVLRPGGDLVLATLRAHKQPDISNTYGHVVHGFKIEELRALTQAAGFAVSCCELTSREKKKPYFEVVTVFARKESK